MSNDCVMFCYELDKNGKGVQLTGDDIAKKIKDDTLAWAHLDAEHLSAREWLQREVSYLDPIILDALLAQETRPRITEFQNGILAILRGVNLNENADPEDMISIRIWIDEHRIITSRRRKLRAVQDLKDKLEAGTGPEDSADFLVMLASRLFMRMEPTILDLDQRSDDIEERIMDNPDVNERKEIVDIRRKAIMLRRYIAPQKDAVAHLRSTELAWFSQAHRRQLQENIDRLLRYIEDLDAVRERAQIIKDELANSLADKMNKNMYVLSVVAAIFLPLGFLTGLLGINVGGMPGAENQIAFWVVVALCALSGVGLIGIFKLLKWL